jgi:hypothetical protein
MRAEELLETLTDKELKTRANLCFLEAENTSLYEQAGPEEKLRLLAEADFYLKALICRQDARVAHRDFRMEVGVMVLIGLEIVLSVVGLWVGYQQDKILDKQTTALMHMDTSTAATSDSLQKLVAAQDSSLKILQQEQTERAKKPRLALYVGNTLLAKAAVHTTALKGQVQTMVSLDLLLKNEGDAPVSTFRVHALVPAEIVFEPDRLITVPESDQPVNAKTHRVTLQLAPLPAGQMVGIHVVIFVPNGHSAFKIPFTVDALELQAVAPVGSLTVLPPKP